MTTQDPTSCPVCLGNEFEANQVLWPELIETWQLDSNEVDYINRQQGYHCKSCHSNLRAMALATAILREYKTNGTLEQFGSTAAIKILEINQAGNLTSTLKKFSGHTLIEYPQFDMQALNIESGSYDLVIHSDTLEHVPDPIKGLNECHRVLNRTGTCIFTVPVIVGRMTHSRTGLSPSYHGQSGVPADDQVVCTEFGADVWQTVLKAGFRSCEIYSFEYPAALVMIARKE